MKKTRFIYFAGVDGCGKSSIIDELIKEYDKKGIKAERVWLRFNYFFTRPVLLFCRLTGLTRRENKGGKTYSIHDFHKSKSIAFLVQYLHLIDTVIAYIIKVRIPLIFTKNIIFCDKFIYDILADFMLETKDLNLLNKTITKLLLKMIPKDMPIIFFSVDKDEIIRRKPEVLIDDEDYDLKFKIYQMIVNKFNIKTIQNDNIQNTLSEVKAKIGSLDPSTDETI